MKWQTTLIPKQNNNMDLFFSFAKRINRPLLLDGAMGSLLQQKGIKSHPQLWMSMANLTHPKEVLKAHQAYIKAGADIITTNTFRTNPVSIKKSNEIISGFDFVQKSVKLAKTAVGDKQIIIAGSNPPAEDCYQVKRTISKKEIEANHVEHIEYLITSGCNFILNETQSHLDEILFVAKFCNNNSIPYVMSLFFTNKLKLLSGENLFDVIRTIEEFSPLAISLNCILPKTFQKVFRKLNKDKSWGFYLNCGSDAFNHENITCGISPIDYSQEVKKYLKKNPIFIGSCCGSSPNHTKELQKLLDEKNSN
ncbi:MAG: homocysteine S-methyltransferase family protein [Ignavibacteriaceae bacterium]|nr:homocysteine S-methyltransferase family protein [Ignavibacteriaceae bacterium]